MNRYNELKLKALSLFAATQGEWLGPNDAAERLNFSPARSAWTYFKRLWSFGLLERRSRISGGPRRKRAAVHSHFHPGHWDLSAQVLDRLTQGQTHRNSSNNPGYIGVVVCTSR